MLKQNDEIFDVVIVGAGPAGLSCAVYSLRGNLRVMFIDKGAPGGKMTKTWRIENYVGIKDIRGFELSQKMLDHAISLGGVHKYGEVVKVETINKFEHEIILSTNEKIKAKAVVIATGLINKIPESIKGIYEYENRGVSYCVICDGPLYSGKPAVIIGGGNSAFEEAIYLSSIASIVYVFVRSAIRADKILQDQISKIDNVKIFLNSEVLELRGEKELEQVVVKINNEIKEFEANHLYPYIGFLPVNDLVSHLDITNKDGFIEVDQNFETRVKGIYAIGDIVPKQVRQILTAASDGATLGKLLINKIK